ncbi:MAG: sensor histidine kinase [Thermoleophilia bacterium]|nr:sensor histidine kinase [Thermoleophilia bacterium]
MDARTRRLTWTAVTAGFAAALGLLAYRILSSDNGQDALEAGAQVVVGWTFVGSGLLAWSRRPTSRVGVLLAGAGLALLVRRLEYADDSALFTLGYSLGELSNVLIAHAILAYPTGNLQTRLERAVVAAGYVLVLAFPLATLAVYDARSACVVDCGAPGRPESLLLVHAHDGLAGALPDAYRIVVFGVLGLLFVALVVRRFVAATAAGRRLLVPVLVAGALAGTRAVLEAAVTFATYSEPTRQGLFWSQMAAQVALPIALVVGLLRARLAHAALADVLPQLDSTPPGAIRDVLARALGDPTLEIVYWVPERQGYVDASGKPVSPADGSPSRIVTPLSTNGDPIAAIVHDEALADDRVLVQDAAAAASLALENARLHAEVKAQLAAVRESRARIVAAADAERRRIERDLHDGAQQRLLALALALRTAERRYEDRGDRELQQVLGSAVEELRGAVDDLRELAHGLHPTILAEQGLGPALRSLAVRSPVPVEMRMDGGLEDRLPPDVEAAAYFVACEALANVVKHACAAAATLTVSRRDGAVAIAVADDGRGGADADGSGLRGLADRVEALGGRLVVASPAGAGTTVSAEIPCAS